jgi:purine-cytosine permease-like protein
MASNNDLPPNETQGSQIKDAQTNVINQAGKIENVGVEYIPEDQRRVPLRSLIWILFGGSETFGIMVIGWVPVSLGLGWWSSLSAIMIGTAIGSCFLAPMGLFAPRTGTNSPVSSGAHFGALGRLIGSALGVSASLVFAALCVWSAGDTLAGASAILMGISVTFWSKAIAYIAVSIVMILIAVMGHANMVSFCKWMIPTAGVLMLVGVYAYFPQFDASYAGGNYALGSFWPTWLASAITCGGTTMSYGPYTGDWTRHLPRYKYKNWQIMAIIWIGGFFGMGHAYVFGAFTATVFADPTVAYAVGLVNAAPFWYLFPLLYIALIPGTAQAVINIYSMGLDFSSIVPLFSRIQGTLILGITSVILVFVGGIYQQIASLVASFIAILIIISGPWIIINIIGFIHRKGYYFPDDLQVFNRGETGGRYWFEYGLELRGCGACIIGVLVGAFFINTGWYVSWGAHLLNGADIGVITSTLAAALFYMALLYLFPEPSYLFGNEGSVFGQNDSETYFPPIKKLHEIPNPIRNNR